MLQIFSRRRLSGKGGADDDSRKRLIGRLLDQRYRIVDVLGEGGFSHTYIAEDTHRPKKPDYPKCVVKHLRKSGHNPDFLKTAQRLFCTEAETLETLGGHSQIPRLLSYKEAQGYLVQEYFEGHPLNNELQSGRCWSEPRVYAFLCEMLKILVFVHGHGVIHRDIKPDNIIRRRYDRTLCLVDFGAVKQSVIDAVASSLKQTVTAGTPGYIPLEQWQGSPQFNSDIYALGIVAAQALTGFEVEQFKGNPERSLRQYRPSISEALLSVIYKMVKSDWQERYQSAQEVLQALISLSEQFASTTVPSQPLSEERIASELPISSELIAAVDSIEGKQSASEAIALTRNQRETILESPSAANDTSSNAIEMNPVAMTTEAELQSPLTDQSTIDLVEAIHSNVEDSKASLEPLSFISLPTRPLNLNSAEAPISAEATEQPISDHPSTASVEENSTRVNRRAADPSVLNSSKWQIILGSAIVCSGAIAAGIFFLVLPWRASQVAEQALQQAKDYLRAGNYTNCANRAEAVPSNFFFLKKKAQVLAQDCSVLAEANNQSDPRVAIKQLASLPSSHPAYDNAQTLMQQMGSRLIQQAIEKYQRGAITSAISLLQDLPSTLSTKVKPKLDLWSTNQKHLQAAQAALKSGKWQDVLDIAKKIDTSDTLYLQKKVAELRKEAQAKIEAQAEAEAARNSPISDLPVAVSQDSARGVAPVNDHLSQPIAPPPRSVAPPPQPVAPSRGPCAPRAGITAGC